jgi:TonB-dependent SusC/RagA subfamily outer membrane receptor
MKSLDQNTIERIDVLKGESAMVIYGSKAKYGAVIITLKENRRIARVK